MLKRWRFVTSSKRMYEALSTLRCKHKKGFKHGVLEGGAFVKSSALYPAKLCRTMLSSLFGWYEHTFCMPCVSPTQVGHRERNDVPSVPVECACAPLGMDGPEVGVRLRTPLGVTKLLDYRETRTNPRAIEAVKAEVEALASRGTWDTEDVQEKEAVVEWAKRTGTTVHIGEGLGICSIKHHEMPEAMQKWKGRFCYRAPTVRDEGGALAIFQEMSSRPTTIVSVNVAIAYGCLKGHSVTAADAVKAYVQSDLNAKHPTFIEIPRHLCPAKWSHLRKPCFRLKRLCMDTPKRAVIGKDI